VPSTWIDNDVIENILWETFNQFDIEFSKVFETQSTSQEELLTGIFVEKLCEKSKKAQASIQKLLETLEEPWYFSMGYKDMSSTEKKYGADIAFVLQTNIQDKMRRKKAILVQCKKMKSKSHKRLGFTYYPSWPIDKVQANDLRCHTSFGYYLLYGPYDQRILTRVIPVMSVVGIMDATGRKTTIPLYQTIVSSKSFADFFLHDFIGCWIGDEEDRIFRIIHGDDPNFSVRYLVNIDISRG
jgi:hypothetical protein